VAAADRRVAVVTGGSSGIGAATARALAARGYRCVVLARRAEPLSRVAAETGGEAQVCDVADREAVERAAAAVLERHPRIALLVNNAGIPGRTRFLDATPERIEEVIRINYLGSVWCLRAFLPGLEAAAPSDVVNVVSVAGLLAFAPSGPYSASKHAQTAFSRAVTAELAPRRIRVHTIFPGFVETDGFPQRGALGSRLVERLVIAPETVAEAILDAVDHGRRESFVPGWYRLPILLPGLAARAVGRGRHRRP
jgi:NAD(P)-dependent dehydrogenase (short-subunit alcohol dehydrogenase family)